MLQYNIGTYCKGIVLMVYTHYNATWERNNSPYNYAQCTFINYVYYMYTFATLHFSTSKVKLYRPNQ